jgi:flagellar hook-length control protein FliK
VKPDFVTMMQQQPAAQHQTAHSAANQGADSTMGQTPVRPQGADPLELFDHTVSIVKNGNRLAVQLEPDGLGKLNINLSLDKGIVNAQIHVADSAARNLIESNIQQIMNTLIGEGLSIGGFSVSLQQHGAWDGTAERQQDDTQGNGTAPRAVSQACRTDTRRLVNLFV